MNETAEMSAPLISPVTHVSLTFPTRLCAKNKAHEEGASPEAVNSKYIEPFLVQCFELKAKGRDQPAREHYQYKKSQILVGFH